MSEQSFTFWSWLHLGTTVAAAPEAILPTLSNLVENRRRFVDSVRQTILRVKDAPDIEWQQLSTSAREELSSLRTYWSNALNEAARELDASNAADSDDLRRRFMRAKGSFERLDADILERAANILARNRKVNSIEDVLARSSYSQQPKDDVVRSICLEFTGHVIRVPVAALDDQKKGSVHWLEIEVFRTAAQKPDARGSLAEYGAIAHPLQPPVRDKDFVGSVNAAWNAAQLLAKERQSSRKSEHTHTNEAAFAAWRFEDVDDPQDQSAGGALALAFYRGLMKQEADPRVVVIASIKENGELKPVGTDDDIRAKLSALLADSSVDTIATVAEHGSTIQNHPGFQDQSTRATQCHLVDLASGRESTLAHLVDVRSHHECTALRYLAQVKDVILDEVPPNGARKMLKSRKLSTERIPVQKAFADIENAWHRVHDGPVPVVISYVRLKDFLGKNELPYLTDRQKDLLIKRLGKSDFRNIAEIFYHLLSATHDEYDLVESLQRRAWHDFTNHNVSNPTLIQGRKLRVSEESKQSPFLCVFDWPDTRADERDWQILEQLKKVIAESNYRDVCIVCKGEMPKVDLQIVSTATASLVRKCEKLPLQLLTNEVGNFPSIELDTVYVPLAAIPFTLFHAQQSEELTRLEIQDWIDESSDPLSKAAAKIASEHSRPIGYTLDDKVWTIAEVCRQYRAIVIVGDPGSGKTTIAQWLALHFGKAVIDPGRDRISGSVYVRERHIKVAEGNEGDSLASIGDARVPVIVRVADYAKDCAERLKRGAAALPLVDFLGRSGFLGYSEAHLRAIGGSADDQLDPEALNREIRKLLERHEALVLIDGLDEIAGGEREIAVNLSFRDLIYDRITEFVEKYVTQRPIFGDLAKEERHTFSDNERSNQVIVTSRSESFHQKSLLAWGLSYFRVTAMEPAMITRFCRDFFFAVDRVSQISDVIAREAAAKKAHNTADSLVALIDDSDYLPSLARTPLLLTVLATVFHLTGSHLPKTRAGLFRKITETVLQRAASRDDLVAVGMDKPEGRNQDKLHKLRKVLQAFALEMQEHSHSGEATEDELRDIVCRIIPNDAPQMDDPWGVTASPQQDAILNALLSGAGLLESRTADNWRFWHNNIREYFAARSLIRDVRSIDEAAQNILQRVGDAKWRQVVLLAIGLVRSRDEHIPDESQRRFFELLIQGVGPNESQARLHMALAEAALDGVDYLNEDLLPIAVDTLVAVVLGVRESIPQLVRNECEDILRRLAKMRRGNIEATIVRNIKLAQDRGDSPTINNVALLIQRQGWEWRESLHLLAESIVDDSFLAEFPIDSVLCRYVRRVAKAGSEETDAWDFPFRTALINEPNLVHRIQQSAVWLRLVIALFGGVDDLELADDLVRRHTAWMHNVEESPSEADIAFLNNEERLKDLQRLEKVAPRFNPCLLYRPSVLGETVLRWIREDCAIEMIREELERLTVNAAAKNLRFEAAFAAFILNTEISALPIESRGYVQEQLARMAGTLRDALWRLDFVSIVPVYEDNNVSLALLTTLLELRAACGLPPAKLSPHIPEYPKVKTPSPDGHALQFAEFLHYYLSGSTQDDNVYNFAVVLDTIGKKLFGDPHSAILALIYAGWSGNRHSPFHLGWGADPLVPIPENRVESWTLAFDAFFSLNKPIGLRYGEFPFEELWKGSLDEMPDLWIELAAWRLLTHSDEAAIQKIIQGESAETAEVPAILLRRAKSITNPLLRFRALLRLYDCGHATHRELIEASTDLAAPYEKALACLELHARDRQQRWIEGARLQAPQISDPSHQAVVFARLVRQDLRGPAGMDGDKAIDAALEIESRFFRVRLVAEILRLPSYKPSEATRSRIHTDLSEPEWLFVIGRHSLLLDRYLVPETEHSVTSCAILTLAMLSAEAATDVVHGERTIGLQGEVGSLDDSITHGIASLAQTHPALAARRLLALRPSRTKRQDWPTFLQETTSTQLRSAMAVHEAESGFLTPRIAGALVDGIVSGSDIFRYRCSLALHGKVVNCLNENRLWRVSRVGKGTLDFLAERKIEFERVSEEHPAVTAIGWTHHAIIHDDSQALDAWVEEARGGPRSRFAEAILRSIEFINRAVLERILHHVGSEETSDETRRSLLQAIAKIAHVAKNVKNSSMGLPPNWEADFESIASRMPVTLIWDTLPKPDSPALLLTRYHQASAELEAADDSQLREEFAAKTNIPLDYSLAVSEFLEAGGRFYVQVPQYWQEALAQARDFGLLSLNALDFFYQWAHQVLKTPPSSDRQGENLRASVVGSLACLVDVDASYQTWFANRADPKEWELLLATAAQKSPSWTLRRWSVHLIGHLRKLSKVGIDSLRLALSDVAEVQEVALVSISRARRLTFDAPTLDLMRRGLHGFSALWAKHSVDSIREMFKKKTTPLEIRTFLMKEVHTASEGWISRDEAIIYVVEGRKGRVLHQLHGSVAEYLAEAARDMSQNLYTS